MKNEQFTQILRAINNVRDDLKQFKDEMNKRWDENDNKWEGNRKELAKIHEKIDKIDKKVDAHHVEMRSIFNAYENSIENMYQENNKRIIVLEKKLKVVSA